MATCWHCHAESAPEHYARVVYNQTPLWGPWAGWRMAGRELVSPEGDRITPERLRGLLFAESFRPKPKRFPLASTGVVRLPARERFEGAA